MFVFIAFPVCIPFEWKDAMKKNVGVWFHRHGNSFFIACIALSTGFCLSVLWGCMLRGTAQAQQQPPAGMAGQSGLAVPGVIDERGNGRTNIHIPNIPLVPPRWLGDFATVTDRHGNSYRKVTIVDPETRHICVYSIDIEGKIRLQSSRDVGPDMQLDFYNNDGPTPKEIREMIQRSRGASN